MKPTKASRSSGNETIVAVERAGDDQPWGKVYTAIIRDRTLPRNVRTIYTYLTTWCADQRSAFPGRDLMSEETDLSVSAIDEAKRIGVAVGLWTIKKVDTKGGYAYNKYVLHDRDGGYVPGSGPGQRKKGQPRGRSAAATKKNQPQEPRQNLGPGHAQILAPARPKSGPYQDKGLRPARIKTSDASGEDAPAGAHEQARGRAHAQRQPAKPTKVHIVRPPDFVAMTDGEMTHEIVAASAAAMKKAGRPLGSHGKAQLAKNLMDMAERHTVDQRVDAIQAVLNDGLADDPDVAWLFLDKPKKPARPNTLDAVYELHDDFDDLPGADPAINRLSEQDYHPEAIANVVKSTAAAMA